MGADKGSLQIANENTWAEHSRDILNEVGLQVFISIREEQTPVYSNRFESSSLIADNAALNIHGPLLGILSAHLQHPTADLFVLACDLVHMHAAPVRLLLEHHLQIDDARPRYFIHGSQAEPLCAIYTAKALQQLHNRCKSGDLRKYGLIYCLQSTDGDAIALPTALEPCFANFNTPADCASLR